MNPQTAASAGLAGAQGQLGCDDKTRPLKNESVLPTPWSLDARLQRGAPVSASGLAARRDQGGHEHDPDRDPTTTPTRNCHILRSASQHRRQAIDVCGIHVGELQADVPPRRCAVAKRDSPHDFRPASHGLPLGQQDVDVQPPPNGELLIREHAHSTEADVFRVAAMVDERHSSRPAHHVGGDAGITPAVGQGAASISVSPRVAALARPLMYVGRRVWCWTAGR